MATKEKRREKKKQKEKKRERENVRDRVTLLYSNLIHTYTRIHNF